MLSIAIILSITTYPKLLRAMFVIVATCLGVVILLGLRTMSRFSDSEYDLTVEAKHVDWSRFAYTQYATDRDYLCNSVMIFESLHRLGSKADRVLMYPFEWSVSEDSNAKESRMLRYAQDHYGVKLRPIEVQIKSGSGMTGSKSYTKLLAFNQTEYDRVLNLDSDATILQTMDELFLAPSSPVAMPLAYWTNLDKGPLTSALILIQPSTATFNRTMDAISSANSSTLDTDIMNSMPKHTTLTILHRPYILLTGEFRSKKHEAYLGKGETWDAERAFKEAKYLHFSDWPVPKPWIKALPSMIDDLQPPCELNPATGYKNDCRVKNLWLGVYEDFRIRRENICGTAIRDGYPKKLSYICSMPLHIPRSQSRISVAYH